MVGSAFVLKGKLNMLVHGFNRLSDQVDRIVRVTFGNGVAGLDERMNIVESTLARLPCAHEFKPHRHDDPPGVDEYRIARQRACGDGT
jgi:hypothetical protein